MAATSAAQEEFDKLVANNNNNGHREPAAQYHRHHDDSDDDLDHSLAHEPDEEEAHRNAQIDAAMRMPTGAAELRLPPASFDSGRATGVKGVIADARSFQTARRSKWVDRAKSARKSIIGLAAAGHLGSRSESETDDDGRSSAAAAAAAADNSDDEESFLRQWRESRRRELESEAKREVRSRRTSPSVRMYGRLDEVDALGYLDAIEKVGRETTVVVFVYDNEVRATRPGPRRALSPLKLTASNDSVTSRPP